MKVDAENTLQTKQKQMRDAENVVATCKKQLETVRKEYKALPLDILEDALTVEDVADDEISALKDDLTPEVLSRLSARDIEARMMTLEGNLSQMKPNYQQIICDYKAKANDFKEKKALFEEVNAARDEKRRELDVLRDQRLTEFMDG